MDAGNTYTKYQNLLLSILPSHKLIDTSRKPSSQNQRNPNPTSKRFPQTQNAFIRQHDVLNHRETNSSNLYMILTYQRMRILNHSSKNTT